MEEVTIIGVDLAKNVFQVHGAAADGSVVYRKKLSRLQFSRFMAEMAYSQAIGEAVISGFDDTRDGLPYVNQIFLGYGGGGAIHGYDG